MPKCPKCGFYSKDTSGDGFALARIKAQREYKRAFESWTKEEDKRLAEMVAAKESIISIVAALERQPSAITRRIATLQLNTEQPGAIVPVKSYTWAEKEAEDIAKLKKGEKDEHK